MSFAFCPDDGLPRLIRRVERGALPPDLICVLDPEQNLLRVDAGHFDALSPYGQRVVLRTQRRLIRVGDVI